MHAVPLKKPVETSVSPPIYTSLALLFSFLWSTGFIAVEYGLLSSPPLFMMAFRFILAGGSLLLVMALLRRPLPNMRRDGGKLFLLGLLSFAGFFGITGIALQGVAAGTAAVLASTNPLMLALVAPVFLSEKLGWRKGIGLLIAFASVVVMMYSRLGTGDSPLHMVLILVANISMVTGTILFKRWKLHYDLAILNGTQLLIGGLILMVFSLLIEPVATVRWDSNFWLTLIYQWFVLSWATMLLYMFLLRHGDASKANTFLFLNPVFGLLLGAVLLGEPLGIMELIGTIGVAFGIYLVLRSK
jgi:drug/metabolite transporter (DMT)-like permease